jgi:DNA-binding CsgD family transcriptional regulator
VRSWDAAERGTQPSGHAIVGRETELSILLEHLDRRRAGTLVVTGDAGLGKTTLWEACVEAARERGFRVLAARASAAETRLSYAGLADLLDGVDREELTALPTPQQHALEVALLRAEPIAMPTDSAVALGLLSALRVLAERPLLVAVDDLPWLDPPSADALGFAARRLHGDGALFLLARRPGRASAVERALEDGPVERLELGPLSYGAIRQLLSERLGLVLPRHLLRRLVETTLGNPLFALEVGRELAASPEQTIGEDLPVPDAVEDLLGRRVARLPASHRTLLLATALDAGLTPPQLGAIVGASVVEDAIDDGLLRVDDGRVRASHPLLAAAARKRSRPQARRQLHRALADVVSDEQLRARHLAHAGDVPDDELSAIVADAASGASARGARHDAVELAEHAVRLTPPSSVARADRVLELAEYLALAGEERRLTEMLTHELDAMPSGVRRARAHLLLAEGAVACVDEGMAHFERALAEGGHDPELRARTLARKAAILATGAVERLPEADRCAGLAAGDALALAPSVQQEILNAVAWPSIMRGRPIDDLRERAAALSKGEPFLLYSVDRVTGVRLAWRGHVTEARRHFRRLAELADARGEATSYLVIRLQLCELELRAGEWHAASTLLDEWRHSADRELAPGPSYERCLALLAAGRGSAAEVQRLTGEVIDGVTASGLRWNLLEALRARGIAALLTRDLQPALDSLRAVWSHTEREGISDPGAFPSAPDLVEALVESGELDEARTVTDRLRELATAQQHPWGLATAKRCEGVMRLAGSPYDESAAAMLGSAADDFAELGLRFDAARSLLLLGRAQRRHRKWAAARGSLDRAIAAFEELGSPGWAAEARSELERVGARRPRSAGQLTPTERRVVALAAEGLSNKEIASKLVVTVNTVETHLSHAYAKLGVRSRAQLPRARSSRR